ncbi:PPC domain-containing protein [Phormidium sp. CLA17]|uniref:PPC domain-containing protein n=1 Tax=Leptolyngbya sp. Cla-17 TaxID=2803751 RepID=UPI0017F8D8A2|nr:PPC domain-containing protein [Leptolyngbya sp. Cla-17]MBM0743831.1 PPC domain-containing protein [Leptolyngbya sp. Cla-17]
MIIAVFCRMRYGQNNREQGFEPLVCTSQEPETLYFRFNLTALSDLTMTLMAGASGDADIYLYRDSNSNGTIDKGEMLRSSINDGNQESLSLTGLATGTYYALIKQYSGTTNYTVSLTADAAGETLTDARNLGTLSGNRTFKDYVGTSALDDFYRFQLDSASNVNFSLTNLSADADLYLVQDFNFNGRVEDGEAIAWSTRTDSTSETISLQGLAAGSYYLRVSQYEGNTNYTLNSSAVSAEPGNTIGNAAELGVLTGQQVIRDAVSRTDTQDFFSLRLSATSNLTLDLT